MSQTESNIQNLRAWFRQCPALEPSKQLRVDYLSDTPTEYSIYASPSTISYRENILGHEVPNDVQTQNFIFASKEVYGSDIKQNMKNIALYDAVIAWVLDMNYERNFPDWIGGTVKSIVPTLTPYVAQAGADVAKYQIQLKITYRRI